jgi:hypothetical protein
VLGSSAGRETEFRYIPLPPKSLITGMRTETAACELCMRPAHYPRLMIQPLFSMLPKLQFCQHLRHLSSFSNQTLSLIRLNNSHCHIYDSILNCMSVVHLTKPRSVKQPNYNAQCTRKYMQGSGRGLILRNSPGICLESLRALMETSSRIVGVLAETGTRNLANTDHNRGI